MRFSANVASLEASATLALSARARRLAAEGRSIVDLSTGEPSFPTPEVAVEGALASIRAGHTGYPPTQGIGELREAVAGYLHATTAHAHVDPPNILVSAGVKQALFNCIFCLFGPDDEVLVPAPYWPTYLPLIRLAGARPVVVQAAAEDGFRLDPDALEGRRTERTRGLILNSPANPSGAVYGGELLADISAWCDRHGIWLLADEIYRRLCWESATAPSVFDVAGGPGRVLLFDGISKSFSMTGWRIGFAAGPAEVVRKATDLQSQTTSGASAPAQYAAAALLGNAAERERTIAGARDELAGLRQSAIERMDATEGLELTPPAGAIYLYPRVATGRSSAETAEALLSEAGVACAPGEAFGTPGYLRFNFAVKSEDLQDGLSRIAAFFTAPSSSPPHP